MLRFKKYPIQSALLNPLKLKSTPCSGEDTSNKEKRVKQSKGVNLKLFNASYLWYKNALNNLIYWSVFIFYERFWINCIVYSSYVDGSQTSNWLKYS